MIFDWKIILLFSKQEDDQEWKQRADRNAMFTIFLGGGGYSGHNWNKDFIKIKLYGSKQRLWGQTMTLGKGQLRCRIQAAAAAATAAAPLWFMDS